MATIPRIYLACPLHAGQEITLGSDASRHLVRVLRRRPGDLATLFNGEGGEYLAEIISTDRSRATLRLLRAQAAERESPLRIHLGQALSQPRKFDLVLQKATELGVAVISPIHCQRSSVRPERPRSIEKMRHWQGVVASACEQCGRNILPAVEEPLTLASWLDAQPGPVFYLHPQAPMELTASRPAEQCSLLIGPEGGFHASELALLDASDKCTGIRLGPRILRTETAPVAALAILQYLWGDLG